MIEIDVTYDEVSNAAYIFLAGPIPPGGVANTYLCDPVDVGMINLDFDKDGRLIGIEVYAATTKLPPNVIAQARRI